MCHHLKWNTYYLKKNRKWINRINRLRLFGKYRFEQNMNLILIIQYEIDIVRVTNVSQFP